MKKQKNDQSGFVYSTNPDFKPETTENPESFADKADQRIRIFLDRLGGNKMVTRINGLEMSADLLEALGRKLKQQCGTGGSVKDGEILIQGDKRDRIVDLLNKDGYRPKKAGG